MYLESNKSRFKVLGLAVMCGVVLCTTSTLTLLFLSSGDLRNMPGGSSINISVGFLDILNIAKTSINNGGYSLEFSLLPGLVTLLLAFCIVAAGVCYVWRVLRLRAK